MPDFWRIYEMESSKVQACLHLRTESGDVCMKVTDFIFRFKTGSIGASAAFCRVRVFVNKNADIFVVLTDLQENHSVSVTNALEYIHQQLVETEKIPETAKIIEHYPGSFLDRQTFDIITYDTQGAPSWSPVSFSKVIELLECNKHEFDDYKNDKRGQKEIYDVINGIPKIEIYEYTEMPEITERRLNIMINQHSKRELQELLKTFPNEACMADFLKKDMSLFAECYAYPEEAYVCFSEFPVGTGRVDFALFTGVSRMTVYFIEIKGANHNLCRQNHYAEFRSYVQEGRGQLLKRAAWIDANYDKYRKFVHSTLKSVKEGRKKTIQRFFRSSLSIRGRS